MADNFNSRSGAGVIYVEGQGLLTGTDLDILLEEFFPEFFELFDGTFWSMEGTLDFEDRCPVAGPHEAWLNCDDRERRYRLLDFLITHR